MIDRRKDAFVMVYAVCTLVLVSSLSLSMVDSTGSDLEIAKLRMFQTLARVNAESGVEYAMAFFSRELARESNAYTDVGGGPWYDAGYDFTNRGFTTFPWFVAPHVNTYANYNALPLDVRRLVDKMESAPEAPPIRMHALSPGNDAAVTGGTLSQGDQFQVALGPIPTYETVNLAIKTNGNPTIFWLRSRGEVLFNRTLGTGTPTVLASAYVTQTFMVKTRTDSDPPGCSPYAARLVFDREPTTLSNKAIKDPNPH